MIQDGHEICFVGDGAFRELSQVDPKANDLLAKVKTALLIVIAIIISFTLILMD